MNPFCQLVMAPARQSLGFGELLLKDIAAERFRRIPDGVHMSSPAFIYGHLATYPNMILNMWGMDERSTTDPATQSRFEASFGRGQPALDDPEGTIYPDMETIVSVWKRGYASLLDAAPSVPAEVLAQTNPIERLQATLPTVGAMSSFLMIGHQMMHLGQVSAWRRVMGLGPCM